MQNYTDIGFKNSSTVGDLKERTNMLFFFKHTRACSCPRAFLHANMLASMPHEHDDVHARGHAREHAGRSVNAV